MKRFSSAVWRFFERIEENNRCVAVVCKLCESQYKYFGNTTNLRVHLTTRHPIQWELSQNGSLDETQFRIEETENPNQTTSSPKRRKYSARGKKNVDVLENSDADFREEDDSTINLVKQMHASRNSDEEWLEEDPYQITHIETYEPVTNKRKKMKYRRVKREVQSPTGLPGFYVAPKHEKTVVYEDKNQSDEYSVFGEYVANKLRKFKTPRTRGNLQQLITTILWQAEYGMYDNADSVKRVLMYSVQAPEPETSMVDFSTPIQVQAEEIIEHKDMPNQSMEAESVETVHTE